MVVCAAVWSIALSAQADDFAAKRLVNWHQWRGPDATGVAPHGDPPINWDEKTHIKWKTAIPGTGLSTPVIWGDRIFSLTALKTDRQPKTKASEGKAPQSNHQFLILCLDRRTGGILWQRLPCEAVPHEGHAGTSSYANASPVTDGRYVYASFGSRGIYSYDMEGVQQWKADLGKFSIKYAFGEGSSPALYQDTLIVNCDHEQQSFITALDARTGKPKWRVPRDEKSTWNTPLVTEHKGQILVLVNGANRARSYDLANGELIWQYGEKPGVDAIPSPMRINDLAIFISGLRGDPVYAVPLGSSGDLSSTDRLAWRHARGGSQISSAVLLGSRLFFIRGRTGVLTCLDARNGAVIIDQQRLPALNEIYASAVATAGRVYFTSRNGVTVVLDATANEVRILAENHLDATISASPAIVGREIFIRGEKNLYCIAH